MIPKVVLRKTTFISEKLPLFLLNTTQVGASATKKYLARLEVKVCSTKIHKGHNNGGLKMLGKSKN